MYVPIFIIAIFGHETLSLAKVLEVAHILSFYPRGSLYFRFMSSGFCDTGRYSELPYLAMKHGKWPKFRKLHIYSLCTPVGRNWAYFPSMGTGFRDTGRLLKLPYLGMKLGHGPKWQKLHIYSFSPPRGRNSKLRSKLGSLYWEWFLRYGQILKIAIFAHETWPLAKVPEIAHILPKLPHESQISLRFALRLPISKILAVLHFNEFHWPQC